MVQDKSHIGQAVLKSFTTIIFYYVGQTPPGTRSGEVIKNIMGRQVFSSSWDLEWYFCFVFEKVSSALPMLLVMLDADLAKCSNIRSQMFFKTVVLKNFAIFTGKHLCWSLFLLKFQDLRPAFLFNKRL